MALGYLKYQHLPFQQVIDDLYAARGEIFDDLFTRCWSLLDEAARRVLLSMPMFVDSISSEALSAVADVRGFAFDLAIERLTDLALLDVQQTDLKQAPRYTLHALVRAFALAKLSEQASFNAAARGRWMDWYIELASKADYCWNDANKLKILDPEKNNIIGILRWCYEHQKYGWIVQLMKKVKFYHYVRGLWGEYQDIYLLGIEATHKVGDFAEEILLLSYYIEVTSFQKKTNTTEMLERLHYLIKENSTNLELKYIYNYYQTLGIYWSERDELDKAYQYWQKALEVALQDRSHFMATAYQNVGVGLYRKKLIPEAQEMFQKAFCQALHFHYQKTMFCSQWRLANIALDKVELDKAKEFLTHSENYLQIYQDRRCIALLKQSWARFYSLTGNDTLANTLKDTANDLFKRLGIKPSEDTCLLEEPIEQWNQVDIKATEQLLKFDSCDFDEVEEG
jgi:tetratricopeptide (TPR) repeat protein